jgi:hypothetical protein
MYCTLLQSRLLHQGPLQWPPAVVHHLNSRLAGKHTTRNTMYRPNDCSTSGHYIPKQLDYPRCCMQEPQPAHHMLKVLALPYGVVCGQFGGLITHLQGIASVKNTNHIRHQHV